MSTLTNETLPLNFMRRREETETNKDVHKAATTFRDRFDGANASVSDRKNQATTMVNEYYDIVTDFYEYGWGQAFHFAPKFQGETFFESLARHEYYLALKGGFDRGNRVLDIGCGVGGPLRNIARFTGANVVGINNNEYQISRAKRYDARAGLQNQTSYVKTDFCNMPFKNGEYDGAYAIEATCHAADKTKCFSEIFRVLKPGSHFVGYEWIVTDKYDPGNEEHKRIRHGIELGNSLPTLETAAQVNAALTAAGFIVEESYDLCEVFENGMPKNVVWYAPLEPSYSSLAGLKATPVGRWVTSKMVQAMEVLHLAPKGTYQAAEILEEAAVNLVLGGKLQIFSPSYFFKARKPL